MALTKIPAVMIDGNVGSGGGGTRLSVSVDAFPETDIATSTLYYGEATVDISAAEAGKNYDVFVSPGGVLVIGPAWTNSVTRAMAIVEVDGRFVNADAIGSLAAEAGELVGGFRCHAAGQTRSTLQSRLVWSLGGAVIMPVSRTDPTDSWSYSAAAWRQANGSALNQIEVFNGVSGRMVRVEASGYMINGTGTVVAGFTGIGIDSSSADSSQVKRPGAASNVFPILPSAASYSGYLGLGYHELRWLERGTGGSQTWYGDGGQANGYQTGILGSVVI
ncbi:hypothetical protein [Rhizobium brockwellii]|jgi:hypothetical protein|uniref:hypothetical protein n=1 Tax=Rhizobium brockwellii TaxID=3019932 RepID=UPI000522EDFD|nr:hypothetical protein [Rhizobium brockwellii]KPN28050.1 hypothetical protein KS05_06875 [Rhizobium brockwellii]QJX06178.1 hypothetical protein RLCC275e_14885 [Rhizobium brockwellii]